MATNRRIWVIDQDGDRLARVKEQVNAAGAETIDLHHGASRECTHVIGHHGDLIHHKDWSDDCRIISYSGGWFLLHPMTRRHYRFVPVIPRGEYMNPRIAAALRTAIEGLLGVDEPSRVLSPDIIDPGSSSGNLVAAYIACLAYSQLEPPSCSRVTAAVNWHAVSAELATHGVACGPAGPTESANATALAEAIRKLL